MALIILHDPYEWIDPEVGRKGMLVHSSQIGGEWRTEGNPPPVETTWPEVWCRWSGNELETNDPADDE